jgi:hypothetical protein
MMKAHLSALLDGVPETSSVLFHEHWALSEEARIRLVEMRDTYEGLWDEALLSLGPPFDERSHRKLTRLMLMGSMNWSAQWYRPGGEFDIDELSTILADSYLSGR